MTFSKELFIALAVVALANANLLFAAEPTVKTLESNPKPKITIGKETTYITEPLRADGYVDYAAAINQRMSKGVTPENNAAVLLAKAYGPSIIEHNIRAETYLQLGIEPLPDHGEYLVWQEEFIRRWKNKQPPGGPLPDEKEIERQFETAFKRPWSRKEFPVVAEWLAANEIPLQLVVEATKRPRYFWPCVLGEDENRPTLMLVRQHHAQYARFIAMMLARRARCRMTENDSNGAWQDILACHRLARKFGQGAFFIESLIGNVVDIFAIDAGISLAHSGKLSAEQAKRCQAELKSLGPVGKIGDQIDQCERFCVLDSIAHLARTDGYGTFCLRQPNRRQAAEVSFTNNLARCRSPPPTSSRTIGILPPRL